MKRGSVGQRVGDKGEDAFRRFGSRMGLLPNKVEKDYGTDFLCLVETTPDRAGSADIKGDLIGAFVRATSGRRPRITVSRSDAGHLLECVYPMCVVMVHRPDEPEESIYFRFLDASFMQKLTEFLNSSTKTLTIVSADLLPDRKSVV